MGNYRKNAGIIVFNRDRKVLLCERVGNYENAWQFPQGGIDGGETVEQAAARELCEETSLTSVRYVASMPEPLIYDFPPEIKKRNAARGIFNDGQQQYWSLYLLTGNESEINLNTAEPEFKNWRWVEIEKASDNVVAFKKEVYRRIIEYFKPLIEKYEF